MMGGEKAKLTGRERGGKSTQRRCRIPAGGKGVVQIKKCPARSHRCLGIFTLFGKVDFSCLVSSKAEFQVDERRAVPRQKPVEGTAGQPVSIRELTLAAHRLAPKEVNRPRKMIRFGSIGKACVRLLGRGGDLEIRATAIEPTIQPEKSVGFGTKLLPPRGASGGGAQGSKVALVKINLRGQKV